MSANRGACFLLHVVRVRVGVCVWLIWLVKCLIHFQCWPHMVQASLHTLGSMKFPYNHSCAGPRESPSSVKTQIPLPQAQSPSHLHYRPDTPGQQVEEECVCIFTPRLRRCPSAHPRMTLARPQSPVTTESIVCRSVSVRGQWIYE